MEKESPYEYLGWTESYWDPWTVQKSFFQLIVTCWVSDLALRDVQELLCGVNDCSSVTLRSVRQQLGAQHCPVWIGKYDAIQTTVIAEESGQGGLSIAWTRKTHRQTLGKK